jgi:phosphate transport system substrate-binding protein
LLQSYARRLASRRAIPRLTLLLLFALAAACDNAGAVVGEVADPPTPTLAPDSYQGTIAAAGSPVLAPLVQRAAFAFNILAPDAFVMVITSTNQLGLANLQDDGPDFALSDVSARELLGSDAESLTETTIAAVPYAVIVSATVGVTALRRDQVRGLYAGSITRWSQIGGANVPVMPLQSSRGTGLRYLFHRVFMQQPGELDHTPDINYLASSNPALDVGRNPGAVAYAPLSSVTPGLRALTIDGVAPSVDAVASGRYPFWTYARIYTKHPPGGLPHVFINYLRSAAVQNGIVRDMGFVPLALMKDRPQP